MHPHLYLATQHGALTQISTWVWRRPNPPGPPYWRDDARGAIVGLTRYFNRGHLARAVLEATAFQTKEVLDAMNADSGVDLTTAKVLSRRRRWTSGNLPPPTILTNERCHAAPSSTAAMAAVEAGVGVGDDQLHPGQAAGLQRSQERGPERAVLAVADVEAEHLAAAVGGDAGRDHDGLGHHPVIDAGLAVGGVEEHVGERGVGQRPVPERGDLDIEFGADP